MPRRRRCLRTASIMLPRFSASSAPKKLAEKAGGLNAHYAETRYPDYDEEIPAENYSKEEAEEALQIAEEVFQWAKKKLGG